MEVIMNYGKLDNVFNLALDVPQALRKKALDLDVGYNDSNNQWEFIVKYSGDIEKIAANLNIPIVKLLNNYVIMSATNEQIEQLNDFPEIEYIEKPNSIIFATEIGRNASCVNRLQVGIDGLYGNGVIMAIIDSGVDYTHPDFRNNDGTTRILSLWDQTIQGNPPSGYNIGTLYTQETINQALQAPTLSQRLALVPSQDRIGHGTHVAGIACGNGRASDGLHRGIATQSSILIVKLGSSINKSELNTLRLIESIDFCIRTAITYQMPVVINLSYGNNYGSHDGLSMLEQYINSVSAIGKTSIVVGTGNEGSNSRHTNGYLETGETKDIEIIVPSYEQSFNIQFWKHYNDDMSVEVISPSYKSTGSIKKILGKQQFTIDNTEILLYYGEPRPGNRAQEIYIEFVPIRESIDSGLWTLVLHGDNIVVGYYNLWLPSGGGLISDTRFLQSTPQLSLTIPSTSSSVISVGAYNPKNNGIAPFSGRGFVYSSYMVKPDLCAPGTDIMSASPFGGYTSASGTSMATPFVSGAVALLMEWGIVKGNDPYLYGEKAKAYLIKGAKPLPGFSEYPNDQIGWGALCLSNSLPIV